MIGWIRRTLSRITALGLAALVIALGFYWLPASLWQRYQDGAAAVREEAATLARLNATIAALAPGGTGDAPLKVAADPTAFLAGDTEAMAAATLQTRLNELAAANGVRLQSVGSLPLRELNGLNLVGARLQFTAGIAEVRRLVHALETTKPLLVIEAIDWRAEGQAGDTAMPKLPLAVGIDVVAAMAGPVGATP